MPVCSVAPSGIREATLRATRRCMSVKGSVFSSSSGRSVSTMAWIWLTWMNVSPCVRGICSFTSAITVVAQREAVSVQSTVVPRLTKPCCVGRRHLHQNHVQRQLSAGKQAFNLAQKDGRVVGAPGDHRLPGVRPDEQSAMPEASLIFRLRIVGAAQRHHVDDFHVPQLRRAPHQRVHQRGGRAHSGLDPDPGPRTNRRQGLGRGHTFLR